LWTSGNISNYKKTIRQQGEDRQQGSVNLEASRAGNAGLARDGEYFRGNDPAQKEQERKETE
jgi:hypothetical protein